MLKTISLRWQNVDVDFLFYRYDEAGDTAPAASHAHVNYEIHLAAEGSHCYELTDREITLDGGHMLIIPPHTLHRPIKASEEGYRFAVLTLKLAAAGEGSAHAYVEELFRRHALQCLPVQGDILQAAFRLREEVWAEERDYLYDLYLTRGAADLFYRLCASFAEAGSPAAGPASTERHVDVQIENLVNRDNMSLCDIAEKIHYSPRQTERLIKKIYGKTLTEVREEQKWKKKQK